MRPLACAALLLIAGSAARAAEGEFTVDSTTCLVRPRQVIQLGSPVFSVLGEVFVDRASVVRKGDVVARLNSSVEEAQLALDRFRAANTAPIEAARTELQWNQRELARRQQLAGNMFSKANEIDEIQTKADQARIAIRRAESDQRTASLEAERSERQLQLRMIRSPVDGVVTEMKLMPGEFVYETTPIMTIAQIDPLSVDLVVAAEHYRALGPGLTAEVQLLAPMNASRAAQVDAIDPVIDAASDTFRVRLTMPNPGNQIPAGIRCSVRFTEPAQGG